MERKFTPGQSSTENMAIAHIYAEKRRSQKLGREASKIDLNTEVSTNPDLATPEDLKTLMSQPGIYSFEPCQLPGSSDYIPKGFWRKKQKGK